MNDVKLDILDKQNNYLGTLDIADSSTFPLAISQAIVDIKDISKRSGVASKTFKVPATAANNKVLQYIYNANINANNVVWGNKGVVTVNGLPVVKGLIRVVNIYQDNSPVEYEIELAGENLDWALQLKDISIRDLDYGNPAVNHLMLATHNGFSIVPIYADVPASTGIHTYNQATIEASWQGSYDAGWDYVYSLKNYGEWQTPGVASVIEMRPDVYVLSVLKKAFEKIGYSLSGSFPYTSYFKQLIMLFTGSNFTYQSSADGNFKMGTQLTLLASTSQNITGRLLFGLNSTQNDFINSGVTYDAITGIFTSHNEYIGSLTIHAEYGPVNFFVEGIELRLYKNGVYYYALSQSGSTFDTTIEDFVLIGGDYFYIDYILHKISPPFPPFPVFGNLTNKTFLSFTANTDPIAIPIDFPYRIGSTLPDIKCIDFISGLANMFNLYFRTDVDSKIVYCETRDSFYKDISQAKDWSGKLDLEKQVQTNFLNTYNRTLQFCFIEDDNDSLVKKQETTTSKRAGSLLFDLPERYPNGVQELGTKQFAYTSIGEDNSFRDDVTSRLPVIIPILWSGDEDQPEASYDFKPRILYYQGYNVQMGSSPLFGAMERSWTWSNGYEKAFLNKVPYADYGPVGDNQLRYDGDKGLVQSYYQNDIAQLNEGKIITAWFYLKPADIMQLDLSYPIYINHHNLNGYYYINKLYDYQPNKNISTKVELIRTSATVTPTIDYNQGVDYNNARLGTGISRGIGSATTLLQSGVRLPSVPIHSSVLHNGSNNWAVADTGSVAIGVGVLAPGVTQHMYGNYNIASNADLFQVGGGTSNSDRYRALTFTNDGTFLVQGGYLYTSDGQEVLFGSQRNAAGQITRFDKLHLQGNQ